MPNWCSANAGAALFSPATESGFSGGDSLARNARPVPVPVWARL